MGDSRITIVGCGPGSPELLTDAARNAVREAKVILGATRLLLLFPDAAGYKIEVTSNVSSALEEFAEHVDFGPSVALVTGDPGLFSLAKPVIDRFGRERCRIIPGISSVQLAFAAAGLTWEDARIVSAHKEYPDTREWAHWDKIAVLGGKRDFLTRVAADLAAAHRNSRFFICEDLSLPTERVIETDHAGLSRFNAGSRTIVLIIRDGKPE